jgi:hypothetical protein
MRRAQMIIFDPVFAEMKMKMKMRTGIMEQHIFNFDVSIKAAKA